MNADFMGLIKKLPFSFDFGSTSDLDMGPMAHSLVKCIPLRVAFFFDQQGKVVLEVMQISQREGFQRASIFCHIALNKPESKVSEFGQFDI